MQLAADEDFAVFVRARQQALVRAAYLVCGDHHAAQDLVQGALAKLAARWEQVRDGSPEAYVRRIVYRDAISAWRRTRRESPYDAGPPELVRLAGADDRDPAQEWVAGADVRAALAELPPRQRAVVVLRYYEDLPEAQIAEVLGISQGTVKSQAHKAMRNLRILLPDLAPTLTGERGES